MHIRNMIKNPDNYGIRSEIILMFIKSFYKILWDRSNPLSEKLKIDNLIGRREEKGFVEIRSNEACERKKMAPLITPKKKIKLSSLEVKEN